LKRFIIYTFELLFAVVDSTIKRSLRGAKRPTWWLTTELSRKTMRRTIDHSLGWGMEWYRDLQRISAKAYRNDADIISKKVIVNDVAVEWFENVGKASKEVILYFHGGGYVYGSTDTHRAFINRIAKKTKKTIISVDYRLAPEHPFPAATDDAFMVYNWLIQSENYKSNQIILMGDSAGGTLCTSILLKLKAANSPMPKTSVLISPWVQPYAEGHSINFNDEYDIGGQPFLLDCADRYLDKKNKENPLVTPIFGDLKGFPPMLIQVGTCEVLLTQVQNFVTKAKAEGIDITYTEYEDMFHTFLISNPNVPQSEVALDEIGTYLES
jgi:acetyl esterase/lipase